MVLYPQIKGVLANVPFDQFHEKDLKVERNGKVNNAGNRSGNCELCDFLSSEMQSKQRLYELHVSSVRVNYQIPRKNNLIPFVAVHCYWGERVPDRRSIIPVCKGRSKIYVNHGLSACGIHWMGNFLGGGMLISSKLFRTVKSF